MSSIYTHAITAHHTAHYNMKLLTVFFLIGLTRNHRRRRCKAVHRHNAVHRGVLPRKFAHAWQTQHAPGTGHTLLVNDAPYASTRQDIGAKVCNTTMPQPYRPSSCPKTWSRLCTDPRRSFA